MKVLLITEYVAPTLSPASIRWSKLVKYLARDYGHEFVLLTNKKRFKGLRPWNQAYRYDATLANDLQFFQRIIEADDSVSERFWHVVRNLGRTVRKWQRGLGRGVVIQKTTATPSEAMPKPSLVRRIGFGVQSRIEESRYRSVRKQAPNWRDYDAVISTYNPSWTHRIAAEGKAANPELVWIADYRDAPVYSIETATPENYGFARRFTGAADCVISVSRGCIENLCLPEGQRWEVVTNGFDEEDAKEFVRERDVRFVIAYTGSLYNVPGAVRDMTPLFDALGSLVASGSIPADELVVEYAGPSAEVFEVFSREHPEVPVISHGLVSRQEALNMQMRASLLVLCSWNTRLSQGIVTGKVFEYLASRVPIVGLVSGDLPGSAIKEILQRSAAGYCYEQAHAEGDLEDLKAYLLEKYLQWKREGLTSYTPDEDYISRFTHKSLAAQVDRLLRMRENGGGANDF